MVPGTDFAELTFLESMRMEADILASQRGAGRGKGGCTQVAAEYFMGRAYIARIRIDERIYAPR